MNPNYRSILLTYDGEGVQRKREVLDELERELTAANAEIARLKADKERLEAALAAADMAISSGQACRSEGEFTRWMRDAQRYRPHADLLPPTAARSNHP